MKCKIYNIEYLLKEEFTEEDLYNLFDTNSFNYSMIIYMFKLANIKKSNEDIIKIITSNKYWHYHYFWSKRIREKFIKQLKNVYKRLYSVSDKIAEDKAMNWMLWYSLSDVSLKPKKNQMLNHKFCM